MILRNKDDGIKKKSPRLMRIGLDAMGGDMAPKVTVEGAILALDELSEGSTMVLFGNKEQIEQHLPDEYRSRIEIVHTTQVIEMSDQPAHAFSRKEDSSISVGFRHLGEGKIDGFASAGSTGAMMVGSIYAVKPIEGVIRPAIAANMVTTVGTPVTILDVGLNTDCKPEVLYQYAILGSLYASEAGGVVNPRVALLNIGEEEGKGNLSTKVAYTLMAENGGRFNFVGNIEGKHIFDNTIADVVVCDGFIGNIILKMSEGFHEIFKQLATKNALVDGMNYETVGGTPILGINSNVIIGHGCSSALAIKNMIMVTEQTIEGALVSKIRKVFS